MNIHAFCDVVFAEPMEGIDPEFLAALPPELQAEVMENQAGGGGR